MAHQEAPVRLLVELQQRLTEAEKVSHQIRPYFAIP